ncbi:MAG: glycosyltransferase, partial [Chitinophagaceae bacterium]
MKIRIIGSAHPLRGGGISTFNERLALALQDAGHDVAIYSFSLQYPALLFPGKSQHTDEPAPKDIKIHSVINSINPLNWLRVGKMLKKENADLIIVRFWTPFMGPAFGTILRKAKSKNTVCVAIADNVVAHEKKVTDLILTRYFFKTVDRFITMSAEVMKDLKQLTKKPAAQLFHPLYDSYGAPIPKESARKILGLQVNGKFVLFFGFIRKYKGLDLLLEAMADPRLVAQNIQLIVAGEYYGDQAFYEGIIAKHQLEKRVHLFTNFIPNEEVKNYFCAADCVALPYRTATQSGITQVAYHFERGMVATNAGGLPEAVKDGVTGIVCEA